jgi:hypothetical protein
MKKTPPLHHRRRHCDLDAINYSALCLALLSPVWAPVIRRRERRPVRKIVRRMWEGVWE